MNPGPYGSDRTAGHRRDAVVRHRFKEAQDQHLAVLGHQAVQGAMDRLGVLGREILPAIHFPVHRAVVDRLCRHNPLAQMPNRPVACDPIEPGHNGTWIVQSRDRPVHVQPDVLEHVFRVRLAILAEQRPHVVPQPRGKPFDQLAEGRTVASLAPEHQHLLIKPVGEVIHTVRPEVRVWANTS